MGNIGLYFETLFCSAADPQGTTKLSWFIFCFVRACVCWKLQKGGGDIPKHSCHVKIGKILPIGTFQWEFNWIEQLAHMNSWWVTWSAVSNEQFPWKLKLANKFPTLVKSVPKCFAQRRKRQRPFFLRLAFRTSWQWHRRSPLALECRRTSARTTCLTWRVCTTTGRPELFLHWREKSWAAAVLLLCKKSSIALIVFSLKEE